MPSACPERACQCSPTTRSHVPATALPAPRAVTKCIQLSITCDDVEALTLLRDRINRVLLKAAGGGGAAPAAPAASGKPGAKPARRPLAPRSLNTLGAPAPSSSSWGGGGSIISLRSGPGGVMPAASGFSLGATSRREALADSAESSAASGGGEDLAALSDEQQRALELVRSGRSIFFTGADPAALCGAAGVA